jgi:hypothetical protein
MNINNINDPWNLLEKLASNIGNKENINSNLALSLAGAFAKEDKVNIEVLKHWELQYWDFRNRHDLIEKKTPEQEKEYSVLQNLHSRISEAAYRALKKTALNFYEITNELELGKIINLSKKELETYPFRRLVLYDQTHHSFYVYKYDHSVDSLNNELGIRAKKIHKFEVFDLNYDIFHAYISVQDSSTSTT